MEFNEIGSFMKIEIATLIAVYISDDPLLFDRALSSIFCQDIEDEVVSKVYLGVDGPITPALEAVIDKYSHKIHVIIRNRINLGLARTLNELIDALEDERLIFRMDADDLSLPGRYRSQIQYMTANPHVDILGTDILEVSSEGGWKRRVSFCPSSYDVSRYICYGVPVAHPTVCIRRVVFDRLGRYPDVMGNEDIAFWFNCLSEGFNFDNIHVPLVEFTVGDGFLKRRSYSKAYSEFKCYVRGIYKLHGLTWRIFFPFARLIFRLCPGSLVKVGYSFRANVLTGRS
jgi:glycosyltransferase involved in cell wall biosynthesis